ncbi:MAG: FAD-linked oxidase C-terminal domain-containing protein [Deltaproteobacteria bacterium]|nr:FAD-linked oxidase C-terminal domain-containing protein [Deltaproteobacteria bacterium]
MNAPLPRPSPASLQKLRDALGPRLPEGVLRDDPELLETYGGDESGAAPHLPDLLARPTTTEEVSLILAAASAARVPVTPRGGGTGRAGGAIPLAGGLVLSLERMKGIIALDPASLTVRVRPGMILGELHAAVEAERLFYPPDPNSLESCHLGGNVATNAGGPRAGKYGVTRDHVLGVEAVLADGTILRVGRQTLKGVAGYDLTGLLVGSEGTLAVITEVTLRLRPLPTRVETALCFFPDVHAAARGVLAIQRAGHVPRALELMDAAAIDAVRGKTAFPFPEGDAAALLLELDGHGEAVFEELGVVAELASEAGAHEVLVARSLSQKNELWGARRILSPSLREAHAHKIAEDIAVPLAAIPACIEGIHAIAAREGLACAVYGHAGDGNLHANLLWDDPGKGEAVDRAVVALFELAVGLGGTITGEHGIGLTKRDYLPLEQSPALIALQRRLKDTFDPAGILNPGKIFSL